MAKYSREEVLNEYDTRLKKELSKGKPDTNHLHHMVFKEIIRDCLTEELKALGLSQIIETNTTLEVGVSELFKSGKTKISLRIGDKILVKCNVYGFDYGNDSGTKVKVIKKLADEKKFKLLYITLKEAKKPKKVGSKDFRKIGIKTFGKEYIFFLDEPESWQKFVDRVCFILNIRIKSKI